MTVDRRHYWLNAKPDPQKEDKIRALCQVCQPLRREFEYERHGTLSLLAGLDVAGGKVKALCRPTRTETDSVNLVGKPLPGLPAG